MATTTTNYGFDVPTSSDLVKNGATQIALLGQDLDTFLFRPFTQNACVNGGMDFWQRGTSFTSTGATSSYGADRWNIYNGRTGTTYSRQTAGLDGFQYSMRVQRDSGNSATGDIFLTQCLESSESYRFAGQTVTLSFYAKAGANYSAAAGGLVTQIRTGTGTDQNLWSGYTGSSTIANQTKTLTTSWQRFSVTGTVGTTATELCLFFDFVPVGTAGANDWFEITGVQLEQGNQASPFTRAGGTLQGELAACQRYYWRSTPGNAFGNYGLGMAGSATAAFVSLKLPSTMRVIPTSIDVPSTITTLKLTNIAATNWTISAIALSDSTPDNLLLSITASGMTANQSLILGNNNNTGGFIGASAEL